MRSAKTMGAKNGRTELGKARTDARWPWGRRLALGSLYLLILLTPLVVSPAAKDSFRLPKLLLSEILALASLFFLSLGLRSTERVDLRALLRHPAILAGTPLVLVATLTLATTEHPYHVREAVTALLIGFASLVGWSLGLNGKQKRRLLEAMILPATLLSGLAILQFHGLYNPFRFEGSLSPRLGLTSLAGGSFDLSAYLVLPILTAQLGFYRSPSRRNRWLWGLAGGLCLYGLAATLTMTSLLALLLASLVLWSVLVGLRRFLAVLALVALVGAGVAVAVEPLRVRLVKKTRAVAQGDVNKLLSGRLDGWRAALWMLGERPWRGVGHGAYRAEFANAKLALVEEGVSFFPSHEGRSHFTAAHNELLEVAAECGWPGALALTWGLVVLGVQLRRRIAVRAPPGRRHDATALIGAGSTALVVLALASFPMQVALVAYPFLLLLSWILEEEP